MAFISQSQAGLLPLREFQLAALRSLEEARHVVCVAPTGSGKSLIYENFTRSKKARLLLISPLVALAGQQVMRLREAGIYARLGAGPLAEGPPRLSLTHPSAWVTSPEKFFCPDKFHIQEVVRAWSPDFLVVDECHCLWEWGHEFRPAFREIPRLLHALAPKYSLWLTATLPRECGLELISFLPKGAVSLGSFQFSEDLDFKVLPLSMSEKLNFLGRFLLESTGPGIIFVPTKSIAARLSAFAENVLKVPCPCFHSSLSLEEKKNIEHGIRSGRFRVVISTNAFGMGMDITELDWAILWQPLYSILSTVQAAGRVGRNGKKAQAILLWNADDFKTLEWAAFRSERSYRETLLLYQWLVEPGCKIQALNRYFQNLPRNSQESLHQLSSPRIRPKQTG